MLPEAFKYLLFVVFVGGISLKFLPITF